MEKYRILLIIIILMSLMGINQVYSQTPVPLGMEDVVWQKEGLHVTSLAFSPTQPYVAVGTTSWPVLLDINTGKEIKKFICKNVISGLCFSDDGKYLFTGNFDGQFIKWNTATWDSVIIQKAIGRPEAIHMIDYNKKKNLVATASDEGGMKIYDVATNKKILEWKDMPLIDWKYNVYATVTSVSFRYDGKVIAIGMIGINSTWLYDIEKRKIIKTIDGRDGQYSPTKNELIVKKIKEDSYGIRILGGLDYYKFDESEIPTNLDIGELALDTKFVFNSLGNKIIVVGGTFKIKFYGLDEFRLLNIIEEPPLGILLSISPDDKYLLTLGGKGLILINIEKYTNIVENNKVDFNIYPNPSQDIISIEYFLEINGNVDLSISNMQGIIISNVFSGLQEQGKHDIPFSTTNFSSGTYFINLEVNGNVTSKKFEIIR